VKRLSSVMLKSKYSVEAFFNSKFRSSRASNKALSGLTGCFGLLPQEDVSFFFSGFGAGGLTLGVGSYFIVSIWFNSIGSFSIPYKYVNIW